MFSNMTTTIHSFCVDYSDKNKHYLTFIYADETHRKDTLCCKIKFPPTISTFKSKFKCFGALNYGGLSICEGRTKRWEERFRSIPGKYLLNTSKIHSRVWWAVSQFTIKMQYKLLNPGWSLYCHCWTLPEIYYDPAAE